MDKIEEFKEYLLQDDKTENTIEAYTNDVIQMFEFLKIKNIDEINEEGLEKFKAYLIYDRELAPKTINRKLLSVNQFLKFLKFNYQVKQIKIHRQNFLDNVITQVEINQIIHKCELYGDLRTKALLLTLIYTGTRISEALQLKIYDINRDYVNITGKGVKIRTIFIPDKLKEYLREYSRYRVNKSDYLFTGKQGGISRYQAHRDLKKYANMCGIDHKVSHLHNFRHRHCLNLRDKGLDIATIADLVGHSDINTTRVYLRKSKNELLDTINNLY